MLKIRLMGTKNDRGLSSDAKLLYGLMLRRCEIFSVNLDLL